MPYVSDKQRRWAHSPSGIKALGGKKKVHEWDRESKSKDLPEEAEKKGSLEDSFIEDIEKATNKKLAELGGPII